MYTKKYFKIPIRVYDEFSVQKSLMLEAKRFQEDVESLDSPEYPDWVEGSIRVPVDEIIFWQDFYPEGTPPEEVAKKGFDMTLIGTKTIGRLECTWKMRRFEDELNKFVEENSI